MTLQYAFEGPEAADLIASAVAQASGNLQGGFAYTALALFLMFVGASAFSYQLQAAMDTIWNTG